MKYFGSSRFLRDIFFIAGILCITWLCVYDLNEFTSLPKGIHFWKQSMQFSIIKNYEQHDTPFLHPEIDNLFNADNTGHLIQEFPILHYISSFFFKRWPFNIRIINFSILLIGLFYLYKYIYFSTGNYFIAFVIPLNVLLIPIVFYYGMSYITDISALVITGLSVYFHEQYLYNKKNKHYLYISWILFVIGGMMRLPVIIFSLSYFLIGLLISLREGECKKLFLGLFVSLFVIGVWYFYVVKFNTYPATIFPKLFFYFSVSNELRQETWYVIDNIMKYQLGYSNASLYYYIVMMGVILHIMVKFNEFNKKFIFVIFLTLFGSLIYVVLWFGVFREHDYYMIPLIPLFPLLWMLLYLSLSKINKLLVYIVFCTITLLNIFYSVNNIRWRLFEPRWEVLFNLMNTMEEGTHWWFEQDDAHRWSTFRKISPFNHSDMLLRSGIKSNDTAICVFDISSIYAITTLNLKGWGPFNFDVHDFNKIKSKVKAGAKFLITYGKASVTHDSKQDSILKQNLVLSVDSIHFYDISHLRH